MNIYRTAHTWFNCDEFSDIFTVLDIRLLLLQQRRPSRLFNHLL